MAASSDAGPLIWLGKCGLLHLLKRIYSEVMIPEAVHYEAVVRGLEKGFKDAQVIKAAVEAGWLRVYKVNGRFIDRVMSEERRLKVELGEGEREAIALAIEREASALLTNDEEAYQVGRILGLTPKGILYILLKGAKDGYISKRRVKEALKLILEEGFWLSPTIVHDFHEILDEL